jgi:hypothetical protein
MRWKSGTSVNSVAKEILHAGVVQTIAASRHAADHRVLLKCVFVFVGGILESLIAMDQDDGYLLFFYRFFLING